MKNVLVILLAGALGCVGIAGLCVALIWWLGSSSMDGMAAWNTFMFLLLVLCGCGLLVGFPSLVDALWEARPSVRAAREEEAEWRAQSELKRVLLIAAERKAPAERQSQIIQGVVAGFEAWTRQWEQEHPDDAQALAAKRQAREARKAAQDSAEEEG